MDNTRFFEILTKLRIEVEQIAQANPNMDFLAIRKELEKQLQISTTFIESEDMLPLMAWIVMYLESVKSITVAANEDADDFPNIDIDQRHTCDLDVLITGLLRCKQKGFTHAVLNYPMDDQPAQYEGIELTQVTVSEECFAGSARDAIGAKTVLLK